MRKRKESIPEPRSLRSLRQCNMEPLIKSWKARSIHNGNGKLTYTPSGLFTNCIWEWVHPLKTNTHAKFKKSFKKSVFNFSILTRFHISILVWHFLFVLVQWLFWGLLDYVVFQINQTFRRLLRHWGGGIPKMLVDLLGKEGSEDFICNL